MTVDIYEQTLVNMEWTHAKLASQVPPPKEVPFGSGFVFRYEAQGYHQAIIQKLARIVSGLRAARLLLNSGLFQEVAALQRMLEDFNEDVSFLARALTDAPPTRLHEAFLKDFYEEEFDDPSSAFNSTKRRQMFPRQKIRAYLASLKKPGCNPSDETEDRRAIYKAYSGFVHGASPQIMDMCYGDPPTFLLRGMLGTERETAHREDLWNYFYRSICIFIIAAKAFGEASLANDIEQFRKNFAAAKGQDYSMPPKRAAK